MSKRYSTSFKEEACRLAELEGYPNSGMVLLSASDIRQIDCCAS